MQWQHANEWAALLATGSLGAMSPEITAENLARNMRALREARGLSQVQLAQVSGIPRATWGNLESGGGNPTLSVLVRVAAALQTTVEELLAPAREQGRLVKEADLTVRVKSGVRIQSVLPDLVPGLIIERMDIPPGGVLTGLPHTPGTREYITCESGAMELVTAGATWSLERRDVVAFRADQKHAYRNVSRRPAVAYAIVSFAGP